MTQNASRRYLLFINDLPTFVNHSIISLFADDTKCLRQICSLDDSLLLQQDLDHLAEWCQTWKISFNYSKCSVIHFCANSDSPFFTYHINGSPVSSYDSHKDLGVILSCNLSWDSHYENIISKSETSSSYSA